MKKTLINILLIITCVCLLTGCGSKSNTSEDSTNDTNTSQTTDTTTDTNNNSVTYNEAYKAYIEILEASEDTSNYTYDLIYIDNDDVPELFINTNVDATGTKVVSIKNGAGSAIDLSSVVDYVEKTGILRTTGGSMDNYTTTVYKLENGSFEKLAVGNVYLTEEALKAAQDGGDYSWSYSWDGVEVTEEEYNGNMNELFEIGSGNTPIGQYTQEEIIELLSK